MKTNVWKFVSDNGQSYEDHDKAFCVVFATTKKEALEKGLQQSILENGESYTHDPEVTLVQENVEIPDPVIEKMEGSVTVKFTYDKIVGHPLPSVAKLQATAKRILISRVNDSVQPLSFGSWNVFSNSVRVINLK